MEINREEIGRRIKAALVDAKKTQRALAKELCVSESSVSAYIHGDTEPSLCGWVTISLFCNKSIDWLIFGKDASQKNPQPTKEDALRLVLTSDPQLVEKIKDDLRHQIQEETPAYQSRLTSNEERLLKAFSLLDVRRQERLIDTAEDMSVALLRGSDQEGTGRGRNCAASNDK